MTLFLPLEPHWEETDGQADDADVIFVCRPAHAGDKTMMTLESVLIFKENCAQKGKQMTN